jgi:hypothetical protein
LITREINIATFAVALRDSRAGERRVDGIRIYDMCVRARSSEYRGDLLVGNRVLGELLATLKAELGPIALSFGRQPSQFWNTFSDQFLFDFFGDLYRVSHPLRRPAQYLRTYRRIWTKSADTAPTIFHR